MKVVHMMGVHACKTLVGLSSGIGSGREGKYILYYYNYYCHGYHIPLPIPEGV